MSFLDEVFELLEIGTRLEKSGNNRIEAATKYYEAVYLMRQVLQRIPQTPRDMPTRNLLEEKIRFYSEAASRLYFDDSSTTDSIMSNDPRSPMSQKKFFNEEHLSPLPPPADSPRFTETGALNQKAGLANSKLSRAIELDEKGDSKQALDLYLSAAELFLETLKLCEKGSKSSSLGEVLRRRLEGALDRIEHLKHPNRGVVKTTRDTHLESKPSQSTSLSQEEVTILKRSSLIASGLFLPWNETDADALSLQVQNMSRPAKLFIDKDGDLVLSEKQRVKFYKWARPSEIVRMRQEFGSNQYPPTMIRHVSPYTIRQQYVTDCSFIASLCICAAYEKRFRKRLISSIIYPQNSDGIPIYNPEGKYIVRLWLNGVSRQVTIDDRLPIDSHSNLLCSHTTGQRSQLELWVSIIEKAYMKLCGGYDFPGSNSGVDLFSLTGWIPERIFFPKDPLRIRDFETAPERAWERLFSANSFGDCLITVSVSKDMTQYEAESVGLYTGHAYAVLDVFQASDGTRLLQMKNPWATKGWLGKYSCFDKASWQNQILSAELGYNPDLAAKHDDGIFWISWDDVLHYFQNIQLSWNPTLFSYRATLHGFWPKDQGPPNDTFNVGENPQFVLALSGDALATNATIWILISRHVTKQEQEGCEVDDYLTIHLMRNNSRRERMWYPHGRNLLVNGAYTNNPHVLVRYDVSGADDKYISVVLSQYQKSQDMGYTLSCYCTEVFTLGYPQKDLPYTTELSGSWTPDTAGGPVGKEDFFLNPMYLLDLAEETTIQLRCSTSKTFAVNVMLIFLEESDSTDLRKVSRSNGKAILDSGNYRHGFTVTETKKVKVGVYTLVVSTFNPGQVGGFSVKVASSSKLKFQPVS